MQRLQWEKEREVYNNFYFYTSLVFGICCIIIGALLKVGFIGGGFILGGVASLVFGYSHVWGQLTPMIKFGTLLATLVLILFLAFMATRRPRMF